jgi:hypothetical protein
MLPSAPWEVDHVLSNYLDSNHYRILELSFIYQADDHDALWLLAEQDNENLWIEFVPETGAIQTFADTLIFDGQELHVSDVYVDKNNDVWGAIRRGRTSVYVPAQVNYAVYPILARLDYSSLQFVPAIGTPETLREQPIAVVFDGEESFWLFVENDGIYHYLPAQESTVKSVDIPDLSSVWYIALGSDGSVYYQTDFQRDRIYYLNEENIFQFTPETNAVVSLGQPDEEWPVNKGLLVDQNNRLWLGSVGYRTSDGNWNLIHSDMDGYGGLPIQYNWASPSPILESSDGRIWFSNNWDGGIWYLGTAWYDPYTGEGCMFTNLPASLVEDSTQRIWMVAGGELYSVQLSNL